MTPGAEFNIHVDPVAADRVLSSGMRITLVPLDVTRQVRRALAAGEGRAARQTRTANGPCTASLHPYVGFEPGTECPCTTR